MLNFNDSCLRTSSQIAEVVLMERDDVADSLERLEVAGRVKSFGGDSGDPSPIWTVVYR
jgi:hypothetical protein